MSASARAGQYWRLEDLKSFDEFLTRRFPESRRKAYYLMSIHEHLPPQVRKDLKDIWPRMFIDNMYCVLIHYTSA
jgi:hypothetical protein